MLLDNVIHNDLDPVLDHFFEHGYAFLGPVMAPTALEQLRHTCNEIMLGDLSYPELFFQHDSPTGDYADLRYGEGWIGPSLAYRKIEGLQHVPDFLEWINNTLFKQLANTVIGNSITLYRAVLWNKAAHAGTHLPWHQDDGNFWGIDQSPILQVWTALDDAPTEAGCIEVVPGTHLQGLASNEGGTVQEASLEREHAHTRRLALPAKAGEALLLHNHIWHRSGRNNTDQPRRAISISYLHADTQCTRKRRAPREFMRVFTSS